MAQALERYGNYLKLVRGCAPRTVETYMGEIGRLALWLQARPRPVELEYASEADLLEYRDQLGRSPAGVALALKSVRYFYGWAVKSKLIDATPFPDDLRVRVKKQEPTDVPTCAQFLELRARLAEPVTDARAVPQDIRAAMIETLAGAGLRVEALLTLCPRHLRFGPRPYVMVDGAMSCKGSRAGAIPISPYAARLLESLIVRRKPSAETPLFPYTAALVRKILKQASPPGLALHPHSLRHFYCAMTYKRNFDGGAKDPVWVQQAAGHSSLGITTGYLSMALRVCASDREWECWAEGQALTQAAVA